MCGLSAIHGGQLLSFACPKESNQRKRHPRIRALSFAEGSLRADGFRPQAIHGLLSKSARSLAPPACGARGFSVHPPPLLRGEERRAKTDVSHISGASAAGTAALCSSGSPLGRGEQAQEIAARSAGARRMRARPISAQGCAVSGPRSLLAESQGHGCPCDRGREGALFLGYFLLGKQKKVTGGHGWPPYHTRT